MSYRLPILLALIPAALALAPAPEQEVDTDRWKHFAYFLGEWEGSSTGPSGKSELVRTYELVVGGRYLHYRTKAVFPPSDENPAGEVHED